MIPCFGLTGPSSGSDAASMRDQGIVVKEHGTLGIRATFKKRYITLAPIAGVVGLAFIVKDPNNLLQGVGSEGITIALLEKGHPGMRIGDRHDPLNAAFMNGTVEGENVFIPMSSLLGGQSRAGFGWNMLMDCLAEGRGISLPALSVAAAKGVAVTVGSYARIRKQFKVPIANMEGVQEALARVGGNAYILQGAQLLTNAMLNQHEQPAVISAIMKQQFTSRMRVVVNDGMDILGGAGICNGPSNFLGNAYTSVPIAITVEGANTLTRSLIQFGQGLTRSHPHLIHMVQAIQKGDDPTDFNKALLQIVGHALSNAGRSVSSLMLRRRLVGNDITGYYESQLQRLTANFAICSDLSLTLGGNLKSAEFISGRFADILSNIYLGYATLWFYEKYKVDGADVMLHYSLQTLTNEIEEAFFGIFANFPVPMIGSVMKSLTFPLGRTYAKPSDSLIRSVSNAITTETFVREQLAQNLFVSKNPEDRVHQIRNALPLVIAADEILAKLRKQRRNATLEEKAVIDAAEEMRERIIQVDSFSRLGSELNESVEWSASDRPAYGKSGPAMAQSIQRLAY